MLCALLVVATVHGDDALLHSITTDSEAFGGRDVLTLFSTSDARTLSLLAGSGATDVTDVVLLNYGTEPLVCDFCVFTLHAPGQTKWQLLQSLTSSSFWPAAAARYKWLFYPDDDLVFAPGDLASFITKAAGNTEGLVLMQPSMCFDSTVAYPVFLQHVKTNGVAPEFLHTASVELQAPFGRMDWWCTDALPLLANATFGWGVAEMWTLKFDKPLLHVGVVNTVCAYHASRPAGHVSGVGDTDVTKNVALLHGEAVAEVSRNRRVLTERFNGGLGDSIWNARYVLANGVLLPVPIPGIENYISYDVYALNESGFSGGSGNGGTATGGSGGGLAMYNWYVIMMLINLDTYDPEALLALMLSTAPSGVTVTITYRGTSCAWRSNCVPHRF